MMNKQDRILRQTCADLLLFDIIRLGLSDNAERIPFTSKGGYVSTELGENDDDEHIKLSIHGFMNETGMMMQTVTVIYFETPEKAKAFLESPEGTGFSDTYSDGQDCFEFTTYAGDPKLPGIICAILKNQDSSPPNRLPLRPSYPHHGQSSASVQCQLNTGHRLSAFLPQHCDEMPTP